MEIEEFDDYINDIKGQAGIMVENNDELVPVAFVLSDTEINIIGLDLSPRIKAAWGVIFPKLLRKLNADAYVMVIEVWRTIGLNKDSPLINQLADEQRVVSELPPDDREESVMLAACINNQYNAVWLTDIKRQNNQRYISEWKKIVDFTSRLFVSNW